MAHGGVIPDMTRVRGMRLLLAFGLGPPPPPADSRPGTLPIDARLVGHRPMRNAARLGGTLLMLACRATPVAQETEEPCAGVGIGLQPPAVALSVGERATFQFPSGTWPCLPVMPTGRLIWAVSDSAVAQVTDGVVEGRRVGQTTVRATFAADVRWSAGASVTVR